MTRNVIYDDTNRNPILILIRNVRYDIPNINPILILTRDVIYDDVRGLIMEVTGIALTNQVDMSCAIYKHTGESDVFINYILHMSQRHGTFG
jgi:hypothetical protein